MGKVELHH